MDAFQCQTSAKAREYWGERTVWRQYARVCAGREHRELLPETRLRVLDVCKQLRVGYFDEAEDGKVIHEFQSQTLRVSGEQNGVSHVTCDV
jgi:predicted nicotinamide N-methyase